MSPERKGFRVLEGLPGIGVKVTLQVDHTLLVRNETALRLSRYAKMGPRYTPLVKVLAPSDYRVISVVDGLDRRMHTEHEDGLGTTRLSIPQDTSRLIVGPYEFHLEPSSTSKGEAIDVAAKSELALPSFVIEKRSTNSIKNLLRRERELYSSQ